MRITTWNVNSVRTRLPRLLAFLQRHDPDVVCLQELKAEDEKFPYFDIENAGYRASVFGQKTYNGVAILSKAVPKSVQRSFEDGADDDQSRFIRADFEDLSVQCVYVPNGKTVGSESWEYKLDWYRRLKAYLVNSADPATPTVLCGDFNIAPHLSDVRNPEKWAESVLCHSDGRDALARVVDWGFTDAFQLKHPDGGIYSWWDYRMLGFPKNDGLRIDLTYVTQSLVESVEDVWVDREERKGKQPSDHAPVMLDLSL